MISNEIALAMKQALEALEQLDGLDTETECVTIDVGNEIDALRKAIAEAEKQQCYCGDITRLGVVHRADSFCDEHPVAGTQGPKVRTGNCLLAGVCAAEGHKIQKQVNKEAEARYFEQWQGQPIEEIDKHRFSKVPEEYRFKLYTAPPNVKQEPVGEAFLCDECSTPFDGAFQCPSCGCDSATKEPVYTSPPQRQPLTDEQEREAFESHWYSFYHAGSIHPRSNGRYMHPAVQKAWEAWQARAAHGIYAPTELKGETWLNTLKT